MFRLIHISADPSKCLQTLISDGAADSAEGEEHDEEKEEIPTTSFESDPLTQHIRSLFASEIKGDASLRLEVERTPLKRAPLGGRNDGVHVYSCVILEGGEEENKDPSSGCHWWRRPNIRATCLSMACGIGNYRRFVGDVYVVGDEILSEAALQGACQSPDLRLSADGSVPDWLANAAREQYKDGAALVALANAMKVSGDTDDDDDDDNDVEEGDRQWETIYRPGMQNKDSNENGGDEVPDGENDTDDEHDASGRQRGELQEEVVTLCIHCRGPCSTLCPNCQGCYICPPPRRCRINGWSHECICATWKVYVERRTELCTFPFGSWHDDIVHPPKCRISEEPYAHFLRQWFSSSSSSSSWWTTELHGWNGGQGATARTVDCTRRRSFADGFQLPTAPVSGVGSAEALFWIPPERHVTQKDMDRANIARDADHGLPLLHSWQDYYALRQLSLPHSPVALLLTFPLTVYHAIARYAKIPLVLRKLGLSKPSPLRIHILGVEKELNFLDLFQEVGFLVPLSVQLELTFVVRKDMIPPSMMATKKSETTKGSSVLRVALTRNLTASVVTGTYGDESSLHPLLDIEGGGPDLVVALNAGLYAYESWRPVLQFLDAARPPIPAVFTDYNEHSGVHCASLGGAASRQSLHVNPFRQPRTMSTRCMNLPQMSNAFLYVFNEPPDELDM